MAGTPGQAEPLVGVRDPARSVLEEAKGNVGSLCHIGHELTRRLVALRFEGWDEKADVCTA
jgi:hypothetical protein